MVFYTYADAFKYLKIQTKQVLPVVKFIYLLEFIYRPCNMTVNPVRKNSRFAMRI